VSAHGIDIFNFEFWQGPAPALPQNKTVAHHRPGADDVALQLLGSWADPFSVVLTSHHASLAAAVETYNLMRAVVGTGWLPVKYADLNYTGLFSVGYHALAVEQLHTHTSVLLIGPGYSYSSGGVLITRWDLQPEAL